MPPITNETLDYILNFFEDEQVAIVPFLTALLSSGEANHMTAVAGSFQLQDQRTLIRVLATSPSTLKVFGEEARRLVTIAYLEEMVRIQDRQTGFHYNASSMTAERPEGFDSKQMGRQLEQLAPQLWQLSGGLLDGCRQLPLQQRKCDSDGEVAMGPSDMAARVDSEDSGGEDEAAEPARAADVHEEREDPVMQPEDPQWIHDPEGGDTSSDDGNTDEEDEEAMKLLGRRKRMTKQAIRRRDALSPLVSNTG